MRKLIIGLLAVSLLAVPLFAYTQAEWQAILDKEAQEKADFEEYKKLRDAAKKAFAEKDYLESAKLHEKAAATDHADRQIEVRAWRLNGAAYALIMADEELGYALKLLYEARKIAASISKEHPGTVDDLIEVVEKNITYCEGRVD